MLPTHPARMGMNGEIEMIDWNGKLEAVHTDGRVAPVKLVESDPSANGEMARRIDPRLDDGDVNWFNEDGSHRKGGWAIRNAESAPVISPAVVKNMLEKWRGMAGVNPKDVGPHFAANWIETAKDIVAEIEDPDITEARFLVDSIDGASDQEIALAAIKRGRELASGS